MNETLSPFTQNDYEVVKREVLYQGVFRLIRYHIKHVLFKGGMSKVFTREILERKSAVAILPYDPKTDEVVLIEQFRAGAMANPQSPWILELVAGLIDSDEIPPDVAKRESIEEANCEILDIYPICEYFVSPGGCNEYLILFCGRINACNIGGIHGLENEHEDIRAFCIKAQDAFKLVQEGKIKTPPAIIGLQWLQLNHEWLRQLWLTK